MNPIPPDRSGESSPTVPITRNAPARPASAPDRAIASIIEPPALMPAYRAAVALNPEARSS